MISATVCLDSSCMRMAQNLRVQKKKADVIDGSILEDLTKTLLIQYHLSGNQIPERMIIYRGKKLIFAQIKSFDQNSYHHSL